MAEPDSQTDHATTVHYPWLVLALGVWAMLCLGHGTGLDVVSVLVEWVRLPGTVSEQGGQAGFLVGERILAGTLGLCGFLAIIIFIRRALVFGALALIGAVPAWLLCGVLGWLAWKMIIVYTTELVHFAQYALVGALFSVALGRGRRPQLAFVITFGLGMLDEVWQHYGLHVWLMGERTHYLDWSDPFLNGVGAFAGTLPAASWLWIRETGTSQRHIIYLTAAGSTLILFPLLLVGPATLSSWFGSYSYYPFWDEHTNLKPVHWVTPYEGIPLIPAFLLLVGSCLDPIRRTPSVAVLAICLLLVGLAIQPLSRSTAMPVHEPVARAKVTSVSVGSIIVDGKPEPVWETATRLGPFVDNLTGQTVANECADRRALPATEARILWSSEALYLLVEVVDDDVWARDLPRDHGGLLSDEGLRIFIDDGGDEVVFYEFDLSPANRVVDQLQLIAGAPFDFDPWSPSIGWLRYDATQVETAVDVRGSLETVTSSYSPVTSPPDEGYTAELRIPWEVFRTSTTGSSNSALLRIPPEPGQLWRLGLYRREIPRPRESLPGQVSAEAARAQLGVAPGEWENLIQSSGWDVDADGNIAGSRVWGESVRRCGRLQAWSPTFLDLRQPGHFGVVEFIGPETTDL